MNIFKNKGWNDLRNTAVLRALSIIVIFLFPQLSNAGVDFSCGGYSIWGENVNGTIVQKSGSFTGKVLSRTTYVDTVETGYNPQPVYFDLPESGTYPINDPKVLISGFFLKFDEPVYIKILKVSAHPIDTNIPCNMGICQTNVYPKLYVDAISAESAENDEPVTVSPSEAYLKLALVGTQIFDGCSADYPIIVWDEVDVNDQDSEQKWESEKLQIHYQTDSKEPNYLTKPSIQVDDLRTFLTSFDLEFTEGQAITSIHIDPDDSPVAQPPMEASSTNTSTLNLKDGIATGKSRFELKSCDSDKSCEVASIKDAKFIVAANATMPSAFVPDNNKKLPYWFKPQWGNLKEKGDEIRHKKFSHVVIAKTEDSTAKGGPNPVMVLKKLYAYNNDYDFNPVQRLSVKSTIVDCVDCAIKDVDCAIKDKDDKDVTHCDIDMKSKLQKDNGDVKSDKGENEYETEILGQEPVLIKSKPNS